MVDWAETPEGRLCPQLPTALSTLLATGKRRAGRLGRAGGEGVAAGKS